MVLDNSFFIKQLSVLVTPFVVHNIELTIGGVLDDLSFLVVFCKSSSYEEALICSEFVVLRVGTLDQVADDRDLAHVKHDHNFRVQKDGRNQDEDDGDKCAHVALVGTARPFKVYLHCRLAHAELIIRSELASDLIKQSSHAISITDQVI